MISDEERREVARRLRETGEKLGRSTLLWYHIAKSLGVRTATDGKTACGMLADLIEPPAKCISKDDVACVLNDALHGEKKLSGINENCSTCCSVSLTELADLVKPSCDRDALLAVADELSEVRCDKRGELSITYGDLQGLARRIREALGVSDD